MQGGQYTHHWRAEKEQHCPSTSAREASEVTTSSAPLHWESIRVLYNLQSVSLWVNDFSFSLYKEPTIFYTEILGWQVPPARPRTRRELADNTHVSASAASCFHWHKPRRRKRWRVRTKPSEHKPAACSCCSPEHRTPFQNSAVISPPRDEVLFVHVRIFDYAKPETWLKAIWKNDLPPVKEENVSSHTSKAPS